MWKLLSQLGVFDLKLNETTWRFDPNGVSPTVPCPRISLGCICIDFRSMEINRFDVSWFEIKLGTVVPVMSVTSFQKESTLTFVNIKRYGPLEVARPFLAISMVIYCTGVSMDEVPGHGTVLGMPMEDNLAQVWGGLKLNIVLWEVVVKGLVTKKVDFYDVSVTFSAQK